MINDILPIYIVNFNTTALTNIAIASIIQNSKLTNYKIYIFDNSTIEPFKLLQQIPTNCSVEIIDNTTGKYINFNDMQSKYFKIYSVNNYASAKHAITIQYIIDNCTFDNMLLFDSDIFCKNEIDFIDNTVITSSSYIKYVKFEKKCVRFEPFV